MNIINFADNHQGFIALFVGLLAIIVPVFISILSKKEGAEKQKNNLEISQVSKSGTLNINVGSNNSNTQINQTKNEPLYLSEKEKLEIKLLEYIKENNGKDIQPKDIKDITDSLQNQIDLLNSLSDKNYINIVKFIDGREKKINHYVAMNVSITLDGKEYLDNIEVKND